MSSAEIEKCVKKENIGFLKDFLDAAVKCGEITEIGKERIKENKALKEFFDEGRDELVETLRDTANELSTLKARIKGDGLEYLLEDTLTDENWDKHHLKELLEGCSDDFIQISTFRGKKDGYTFKTDSQGTGYYKNGATFEESSEEEDLIECEGCSRVWDGNAQCPCGMDEDIFEGRTTFPSESTEETNQFILRYIDEEWKNAGVKYKEFKGPLGHVSYRIFKVDTSAKSWEGAYILRPSESDSSILRAGTIDGKDSLGEDFSLDLLGKPFEELDNVLCILQDGVEDPDEFEGRTTFPTENTDATNQFIIRYIAKEWQELTYMKKNYADEVAYSITKRRTNEVPNSPEYILNGKGSCGIMSMDSDWGREGFILDLKGEPIKVIKGFLQDLVNVYVPS
jgi:hypothetical protein